MVMDADHIQSALDGVDCEIRLDELTRQLYATDASIYQMTPLGVAFPKSAWQAAAVLQRAADNHISITPRGAGTGLAGGAVSDGLVVDFARHNQLISDLNVDAKTVRVGAGGVLDQLNAFLKPNGLRFGPDVATSSRATLGGMIANDSSGSHAPLYGTTGQHVRSIEVVLADGRVATIGEDGAGVNEICAGAAQLAMEHDDEIRRRFPSGLVKRQSGYGWDRFRKSPGDLTRLIAGSEGTLAGIFSAELNLVPLPMDRGLGLIFFDSVADAMQATVELLDLDPVAIEHIDRILFDQTKGQMVFAAARAMMDLDNQPCESVLVVEFFDQVDDKLEALANRPIGRRKLICRSEAEQALIWSLRKAGLSLLTSRKGPAKPIAGIEDAAVRPEQLPAYVAGLRSILDPLGVEASYYGHAASGLLHVRPVLDLHRAEDVAKLRHIANEVSALVLQFNGAIAAEHGVGMARTEFLAAHLGPQVMDASRRLKRLFDPKGVMNPGKIVPRDRFRIDANLRQGAGAAITLPFAPKLGFVERDRSFVGNLEQCNGNGACLKRSPTMCPTFVATGEEIMSTRGRANVIRATLEGRLSDESEHLRAALDPCLSCKACKSECPSNVDLALLKAELNHARIRASGPSLLDRMVASCDTIGRIGTTFPSLFNGLSRSSAVRGLMEKVLGLSRHRTAPAFAADRFDRWFARRGAALSRERPRGPKPAVLRGRVVLWDDTWVRYPEPGIGQAAVEVLEAAGFEVVLPVGRVCCGRPAFSRGMLDDADYAGRHNVALLLGLESTAPIVFLEPSCYSMFVDDYRQLGVPGADQVASRCVLFEAFMDRVLSEDADALHFGRQLGPVAIHGHCHAKALTDISVSRSLVQRLPAVSVKLLDTGCCGMAGAFGMMEKQYELSMSVGQPLAALIAEQPAGAHIIASGTSCRHQIQDMADRRALHMAELIKLAL